MYLIETPIIENGTIVINKECCRQSSIVLLILANVFLRYVIDIWFAKISKENLIEQTGIARYCDDMVFVFENESRCEKVL
ncbi:putative reverse transcriptase [Orientia tsutsugamushi str. TA716]|uniref:Putative reverse transcriptase n=1 Tax=Orientia tsutsugamushi str. TA716 TaxID=1359175 RepID=A0A0F3P8A1_ORITS|nr:putative reverse transcriptase [Orientia tsutsugamushi str. TA716]